MLVAAHPAAFAVRRAPDEVTEAELLAALAAALAAPGARAAAKPAAPPVHLGRRAEVRREDVAAVAREVVDAAPCVDVHTHLPGGARGPHALGPGRAAHVPPPRRGAPMVDDGLSPAASSRCPSQARTARVLAGAAAPPVSRRASAAGRRPTSARPAPRCAARAGRPRAAAAWYAARAPATTSTPSSARRTSATCVAVWKSSRRDRVGGPTTASRGRLHERALRRARRAARRRGLLRDPATGLFRLAPRRRRRGDGRRPLPHRAARRRALAATGPRSPGRARGDATLGAARLFLTAWARRYGAERPMARRSATCGARRRGPRARLAVGAARRRGPGARRARPDPCSRSSSGVRRLAPDPAPCGGGDRGCGASTSAAPRGCSAWQPRLRPGDAARARGPAEACVLAQVPQPAPVGCWYRNNRHHPRAHSMRRARDGLHRATSIARRPARLRALLARRHREASRPVALLGAGWT